MIAVIAVNSEIAVIAENFQASTASTANKPLRKGHKKRPPPIINIPMFPIDSFLPPPREHNKIWWNKVRKPKSEELAAKKLDGNRFYAGLDFDLTISTTHMTQMTQTRDVTKMDGSDVVEQIFGGEDRVLLLDKWFSELRVPLFVISHGVTDSIKYALEKADLLQHFEGIYGADEKHNKFNMFTDMLAQSGVNFKEHQLVLVDDDPKNGREFMTGGGRFSWVRGLTRPEKGLQEVEMKAIKESLDQHAEDSVFQVEQDLKAGGNNFELNRIWDQIPTNYGFIWQREGQYFGRALPEPSPECTKTKFNRILSDCQSRDGRKSVTKIALIIGGVLLLMVVIIVIGVLVGRRYQSKKEAEVEMGPSIDFGSMARKAFVVRDLRPLGARDAIA